MANGRFTSYSIRDAKGVVGRTNMYFDASAGTAAQLTTSVGQIATDLQALTNGVLYKYGGAAASTAVNVTYPGGGSVYQDAEDKAEFFFSTAGGSIHRYSVSAPINTIFLADAQTIDPTQTVVKQFVADVLGSTFAGTAPISTVFIVARDGTRMTAFYGGIRTRRRLVRRGNIFTLTPTLQAQVPEE